MHYALYISAGVDTSRYTLRFVLMHMAQHPEIQKKVQDEIDSVVCRFQSNFLYQKCLGFIIFIAAII